MARVPITVMGFRCDRCGHEWVPRSNSDEEPRVCPSCHSALWNQPEKKPRMSYESFRDKIVQTLRQAAKPLTWTEVRTAANLPQAFPNNQWVHRMESDVGLVRRRESSGMIHWTLKEATLELGQPTSSQTPNKVRSGARGKQSSV